MKLVHGGDTVGYREKYGRDALDFSANVSPLGTPERNQPLVSSPG